MSKLLRASAAIAVGITAIVAGSTAAGADPKTPAVHLVCDGTHYQVAVNGNGQFTPAHDLASTAVFVPVRFGSFHMTITDVASGAVVFSETDPTVFPKGNAQVRGRTLGSCSYTFTEQFVAGPDDEGLVAGRLYRVDGGGQVTGFATGRR